MIGRESLKILFQSWPGRVGVIFLATLCLVSVVVVIRLPLNFGSQQWNDPIRWADNPKAASPIWINLFPGSNTAPHRTFESHIPNKVNQTGKGEQRFYSNQFEYRGGVLPDFISLSLTKVTFEAQPPIVSVVLKRPDGKSLMLYRDVIRGPRPGEHAPFIRHSDTPLRVNLSGSQETITALSSFLLREFQISTSPENLEGKLEQMAFSKPAGQGSDQFIPLVGTYHVETQVFVSSPGDSIASTKIVLAGSAFGLMGTDAIGRDLALGLLFGFPVALAIGLITSLIVTTIGTFMGIVSGFLGGKVDLGIQRFSDIWSNIPLLPILIFLIFVLGQHLWLVLLILILFGWPGLAIVVRSMVLQIRSGQLVEATRALGASRSRIMFHHILFYIAPFVFAQMVFFTPAAILAEAGLSFLGLGDPSIPTWGQILESGFRTSAVYLGYWWWVLPPGLLIMFTAITFVLLALGLEPIINPKLRRAR